MSIPYNLRTTRFLLKLEILKLVIYLQCYCRFLFLYKKILQKTFYRTHCVIGKGIVMLLFLAFTEKLFFLSITIVQILFFCFEFTVDLYKNWN